MRFLLSCARVALLAIAIGLPLHATPAQDAPADSPHCTCAKGKGCWHYLRSPLRPPEDPCRCPVCSPHGTCAARAAPEGWSEECMNAPRIPCFWLRHGASWSITCSICAASDDCRPCAKIPGAPDVGARALLARQLTIETNALGKLAAPGRDPIVIAFSPHFYVVSDELRHKLHTQGGGERMADQHELVHLTLERAEKAYDDWVTAFGDDMTPGRIALYVTGSSQRREAWGSAFFDGPTSTSMYGDDPVSRMSGGFCGAGLPIPLDRRGDDRDIHAFLRHMLGHMFFSRWHGSHVDPTSCPPWASAAAAEWLERSDPLFAESSVYWSECNGEGHAAGGSGAGWEEKARVIAGATRDPIGKLLGLSAEFHMTAGDYVRAWSYFSTMLREDRLHWIALLKALREGKDRGVSFDAALGCSPDEFDRRWAERLTGKRASMAKFDALATFGSGASAATATVAASLKSPIAPVKLASSRTLARIGTADAIDPLIEALEAHSGRLAAEIHAALKAITRVFSLSVFVGTICATTTSALGEVWVMVSIKVPRRFGAFGKSSPMPTSLVPIISVMMSGGVAFSQPAT